MAPKEPNAPLYPLYSTTYSTHRLSPLYHGSKTLDNATMRSYGSQFRDLLVGDVLRGVRVGLSQNDEALGRVGGLQIVQWKILKDESKWLQEEETQVGDESTIITGKEKGLHLEVVYERAVYTALLLQNEIDPLEEEAQDGFTHFPLLLTRMPGSLRDAFIEFLATTFDCRAVPMKLPPRFLTRSFEAFIKHATTDADGPMEFSNANQALRSMIRDVLVSITIDLPSGNSTLKTIDVGINRDDLWNMLSQGKKLADSKKSAARPFATALEAYIDGHLALDMTNSRVSISKIACGGFVLGSEGKIKLFAPGVAADENESRARASEDLVSSLIELASGSSLKTPSSRSP